MSFRSTDSLLGSVLCVARSSLATRRCRMPLKRPKCRISCKLQQYGSERAIVLSVRIGTSVRLLVGL
jgi:hypothetical protein